MSVEKEALVTGANSGIGKANVAAVADAGFKTIMPCLKLLSKMIFLTVLLLLPTILKASEQGNLTRFREISTRTNTAGMTVLGSWALINMASGIYGWSKFTGEKKYFFQMNFFWNTVNLSIAAFSVYSLFSNDFSILSSNEFLARHIKTEKTLLINSFLDAGYIGAGFLMKYFSGKTVKGRELLKGYGNSLLLQGGFLLVFDAILYGIFRFERLDFLQINIAAEAGLMTVCWALKF